MAEDTEGKWLGVAKAPGDRALFGNDDGVYAVHAAESPPGPEPPWDDNADVDLYCAHHVTLEDGRLLAVTPTWGQQ